ncbi:MAG: hypothetical protein NXI32_11835 [bacterium]|nr:hypothetical protein [bacterium]
MKHLLVSAILLAGFVSTGWIVQAETNNQQGPITEDLKPIMKRKLDSSKVMLEALALEDFDSLAKNARALSLLSLETDWQVLSTEEYLKQSADFRRSLEVIRSAAEKKNIDRAALGYVEVTIRCVECHKYVRSKQGGGKDRSIGG